MRILKMTGVALIGLLLIGALALAVPSPRDQVKQTVNQVLEILRNKSLTGQPRRETLSRVIRVRFDFTIMSQRTLGKYWKEASVQEQARFVALFSDLLEASYVSRLEAYSGETVNYLGERIDGDMAEVDTSIHSGNLNIPTKYRLVLENGQWLVYDVVVEEVSLIRNYRNSYGEIVRREGYPGLFERMEEKLKELKRSPAKGEKG